DGFYRSCACSLTTAGESNLRAKRKRLLLLRVGLGSRVFCERPRLFLAERPRERASVPLTASYGPSRRECSDTPRSLKPSVVSDRDFTNFSRAVAKRDFAPDEMLRVPPGV